MSVNKKAFRLPLAAKDGMFYLNIELEHGHWHRDVSHLRTEIHDIIKCKNKINKVLLTDWVCFDEQNQPRGKNAELELDITEWFLGPRGPVHNEKVSGISFAHAINQKPTLRTPWVKDARMDVKLIVQYSSVL